MSEKLYALFLKLYPDHFRRTYGDEALRLVRDRARDERGFLSGLRLWLDLLVDLAISLPREYRNAPTAPVVAAQPGGGRSPFQLLDEPRANPALLLLAGVATGLLFWACVTAVARNRTFPALFSDTLSLQALVQNDLVLARSRPGEEFGVCITAQHDIPNTARQPLLTFVFAPSGASGVALIDGKIVKKFMNEQSVSIRADVSAGDHRFALHLDKPAESASITSNSDLKYCAPE